MVCTKCGNNNPDDAVFCVGCGTNLTNQFLSQKKPDSGLSHDIDTAPGAPSSYDKLDHLTHTSIKDNHDALDSGGAHISSKEDGFLLSIGSLFASRYEILTGGKKGGMGVVYKVKDTKLNKIKALKVIHPRLLSSPQALSRFRQEVSLSQDLHHVNIVSVYDLDECHGREFFTMEWIEGPSLRELLAERRKEQKPFTLEEAYAIISQLSNALSYAHQYTIHRDIKPENILIQRSAGTNYLSGNSGPGAAEASQFTVLDSQFTIKLTDFGIAKMLSPAELLTTSLQMGTPYYMAPEQKLDAAHVDHRADIYAVGVVFFELLTLENTIGPDLPSELNCAVPKEVDGIYRKAVATRPENRWGEVRELSDALHTIILTERRRNEEGAWKQGIYRKTESEEAMLKGLREERLHAETEGRKIVEEEKRRREEEKLGKGSEERGWKVSEEYLLMEQGEADKQIPADKLKEQIEKRRKPSRMIALGFSIFAIIVLLASTIGYISYRHTQQQIVLTRQLEKERREKKQLAERQKEIEAKQQADLKKLEEQRKYEDQKRHEDVKKQEGRIKQGQLLLQKARASIKKGNLSSARSYLEEAKGLIPDDKNVASMVNIIENEERKLKAAEDRQRQEEEEKRAEEQRRKEAEERRVAEEQKFAEQRRQKEELAEKQKAAGTKLQGAVIKLNYSNFFPAAHLHGITAEKWCREIEKKTRNRVKFAYYPGGTLAPPAQAYDSVAKGTADIGMGVFAYTKGKFPLTEVIDLPLGYRSGLVATRLINEYYKRFRPNELGDVKVLYLHAHGPGILHTKNPVYRLEDLRGMKIRATGPAAKIAAALGATPVAIPMPDAYNALRTGVAEGALVPIEALQGWKWGEVINATTQCFGAAYSIGMFVVMNKSKWNSLPPDIQRIFEQVSAEWIEVQGKAWDEIDKQGRAFTLKRGNKLISLSHEEDARWAARVRPLLDEYVRNTRSKGLPGDEVLKFCLDYLARYKR